MHIKEMNAFDWLRLGEVEAENEILRAQLSEAQQRIKALEQEMMDLTHKDNEYGDRITRRGQGVQRPNDC
jgi:hypothetical protein